MTPGQSDIIDAEETCRSRPQGRRGDGGLYLVVTDDSSEFELALRYAARRAQTNRAHVGILHVISIDDFQHWGNVEAMIRTEMRTEAEKFIWSVARRVNELNGLIPVLYIREGNRADALVDVINEDMNIKVLILGGGTSAVGPGPLVTYFTGKGLSRLRVPLMVVPGNSDPQKIDMVAS